MANKSLDIVIKVRDAATGKLREVQKSLKDTGKAAQDASTDFTKFNRVLFSATAFIGTFQRAFTSIGASIEKGAEFDRLSTQFERVLGPRGAFFQNVKALTDNSIDQFTAMQEAISLKSAGIVKNGTQIADLIAKAGTAAKMAGKSSEEGITHVSKFLKDGSISHLEFLNLISRTNPELQAQLSILKATGGVLGTVIETQQKLRIGTALLDAATKGFLKGQRDLLDVIRDFNQFAPQLRAQLGILVGTALTPVLDKIVKIIKKSADFIENLRKTDKTFLVFTKNVILVTSALTGFIAVLGTLRLTLLALSSIGIGIPQFIALIAAVGLAFKNTDKAIDGVIGKLKGFFEVFRGVVQLVSNLDPATGISKMDKSLHDFLKKQGLLEITLLFAKMASVVKAVVKDISEAFDWLSNKIGKFFDMLKNFLGDFKGLWSNFWVSESLTPVGKFARAAAVVLGGILAFKAMKGIGGLLSKIPVIGKLFGGGSRGDSPQNPLYVQNVNGLGGLGALDFGGVMGDLEKGKLVSTLSGLAGTLARFAPLAYGLAAAGGGIQNILNPENAPGSDEIMNRGFMGNLMHPGDFAYAFGRDVLGDIAGNLLENSVFNPYKTATVIPSMPEDNQKKLDILNKVQSDLRAVDVARADLMGDAIARAFEQTSDAGNGISSREWADIFRVALDNSVVLSNIDKGVKDKPLGGSSRR